MDNLIPKCKSTFHFSYHFRHTITCSSTFPFFTYLPTAVKLKLLLLPINHSGLQYDLASPYYKLSREVASLSIALNQIHLSIQLSPRRHHSPFTYSALQSLHQSLLSPSIHYHLFRVTHFSVLIFI